MTKMTAARYLAESFDSYGVSSVFLVPTILSKTLFEIEQHTGIKRVVTHGEKAAAYMADGYARASGNPGVCMASEFPRALEQALSGAGPALIDVVTDIEAMAPPGRATPAADRPDV
jgi:acetolactate synthase-1/2/3 large subunit